MQLCDVILGLPYKTDALERWRDLSSALNCTTQDHHLAGVKLTFWFKNRSCLALIEVLLYTESGKKVGRTMRWNGFILLISGTYPSRQHERTLRHSYQDLNAIIKGWLKVDLYIPPYCWWVNDRQDRSRQHMDF